MSQKGSLKERGGKGEGGTPNREGGKQGGGGTTRKGPGTRGERREGKGGEGDGRCRRAVAKGGGHVPQEQSTGYYNRASALCVDG